MRRYLAVSLIAFVAALTVVGMASAQSGHFVGDVTCKETGLTLTCSGKVAGLGSTTFQITTVVEGASADVECTNPGGNVAPGQSFTFDAAGTTGQVSTPRSGQFRFTFSTTAVLAPAGSCPNEKWNAEVVDVNFSGLTATVSLFEGSSTTSSDTVSVLIP